MTAAQCSDRVKALDDRLGELRLRQQDLEVLTAHPTSEVPTVEALGEVRTYVERVIREGTAPEQKAVLQALVEEVRVVSRDHIDPAYRVLTEPPATKVRIPDGLVGPAVSEFRR